MKTTQNKLKEKIKKFRNQDVIIIFDDIIESKFEMKNISIYYDKRNYLHIKDKKNIVNINFALVYDVSFKANNFKILLEDSLTIKVIKRVRSDKI